MRELSSQPLSDVIQPTAPAPANVATATDACPRCSGHMLDATGIVWCPGCGYCPMLEKPAERAGPAAPRAPSKLGAAEFFKVVASTPDWLGRLLVGVFAAVAVSLVAHLLLIETAHDRAVWGLWQFAAGLVLVVGAHVLALRQIPLGEIRACSRSNGTLTGLWRATFDRLPATRWPVNLLSWGVSLVVCSVLIVGGLGWWIENVHFTR